MKLPDVEIKKKLFEVNNITLKDAMDKVRTWEASREEVNQMVTPSQEPCAGTNAVEESPGRETKVKSFGQKFSASKANFTVVESGRCLLGYSTSTDLGILRVDPMGNLGTGVCSTVDDTFVTPLCSRELESIKIIS